jgi:hypothetical protein
MSEAQRPLLPDGWQLIPGGMLEELETVSSESEGEPIAEVQESAKEVGRKALKSVSSESAKKEKVLYSDADAYSGMVIPIHPSPLTAVLKGSAEPSISGVNVIDSEMPDDGAIRAFNAISHFMKVQGGRSSEELLMGRLLGAGFGDGKAQKYIEQACAKGILIKVGKFYKTPGQLPGR